MFCFDTMPADIMEIYNSTAPRNDNPLAFVQANDFQKVIQMTKYVALHSRTYDELSELFGFTMRQAYMYAHACKYLGLLRVKNAKEGQKRLYATKKGREFARMQVTSRKLYLAALQYLLEDACFYFVFSDIVETCTMPSQQRIMDIMQDLHVCSDAVLKRRSSTVSSWFRYLLGILTSPGIE